MTAVTMPEEFASVDPIDISLFSSGLAHPYFTWLRANDPVHWDPVNELWVVTKYEDISAIERSPRPFSSAQGIRPGGGGAGDLSIISMDDPEHARQRKLISKAFTPSRINSLMDRIRQVAHELVDEIAPLGECDFVESISYPLPLIVIAEMLGLPIEDRRQLAQWSDAMMSGDMAPDPSDRLDRASAAWAEYVTYLVTVLEDHKQNPRDDLISVLLAAMDEGEISGHEAEQIGAAAASGSSEVMHEQLGDDELLTFLVLLLVAGNETTRNAISGGMAVLSEHPDQMAKLAADPELIPSATEEIVRWVSPVLNFTRTLTDDVELRGKTIAEGQRVLLVYPSANRDEDQFENPFEFDIERSPNLHLAFGGGPHFCLGANLARTEIRIMFEVLLSKLPDIRVKPGHGPTRGDSALVATMESLPVVYTPVV